MKYFYDQILNILILSIILFWVFFNSYFKKKGENLATKEDIKDITDLIENTKNKYIAEIETLKTNLNLYSDSASKIQEKARDTLISMFEDCLILITEKLRFNFGDFPYDGGKTLYEYQKTTNELFIKIYSDYYKILLYFFENEEIKKAVSDVVFQMLKVATIFRKEFGKVKMAYLNEMNIEGRTSIEYSDACSESYEAVKDFIDKTKPEKEKFIKLFHEYLEVLNKNIGVNTDLFNKALKLDQ